MTSFIPLISFCLPCNSFCFPSKIPFAADFKHEHNKKTTMPSKSMELLITFLYNHWPEAFGEHLSISGVLGCELCLFRFLGCCCNVCFILPMFRAWDIFSNTSSNDIQTHANKRNQQRKHGRPSPLQGSQKGSKGNSVQPLSVIMKLGSSQEGTLKTVIIVCSPHYMQRNSYGRFREVFSIWEFNKGSLLKSFQKGIPKRENFLEPTVDPFFFKHPYPFQESFFSWHFCSQSLEDVDGKVSTALPTTFPRMPLRRRKSNGLLGLSFLTLQISFTLFNYPCTLQIILMTSTPDSCPRMLQNSPQASMKLYLCPILSHECSFLSPADLLGMSATFIREAS